MANFCLPDFGFYSCLPFHVPGVIDTLKHPHHTGTFPLHHHPCNFEWAYTPAADTPRTVDLGTDLSIPVVPHRDDYCTIIIASKGQPQCYMGHKR